MWVKVVLCVAVTLAVAEVFCCCGETPSAVSEKGRLAEGERNTVHKERRAAGSASTTVFHDDFSSGHLDPSKWTHDVMAVGRSSGHFQMWTPERTNSYVKNGVLYIRPTFTVQRFGEHILDHGTINVTNIWGRCHPNWGGDSCVTHDRENRPIMSALIRTTAAIRYGRVEVVARLPKGDWIWPAIWMMPNNSVYGGWPRSGEIDIMEAAGNRNLKHPNGLSVGVDCDHSTIHYGTERSGTNHARHGQQYRLPHGTFADDFHTYWLDWTKDYIKIGVDSHTVLRVDTPAQGFWNEGHLQGTNIWAHGDRNAPFDQPFYLILNVAVGNGFFWDGYINGGYKMPWNTGAQEDYRQFWDARHLWQPSWHGEDVAMRIRSVTMKQYH